MSRQCQVSKFNICSTRHMIIQSYNLYFTQFIYKFPSGINVIKYMPGGTDIVEFLLQHFCIKMVMIVNHDVNCSPNF